MVWVVHGRDERLRRGLFDFLRCIGLKPLEFLEARKLTKNPTPYIGDILETAFEHAQAIVVLFTPDDEGRLRPDFHTDRDIDDKQLTGQARLNVIFEAGMACVTHPKQTVLVQIGEVRPFSDVAGRHVVHLDGSTQKRQELAARLGDAGCPVNLSGIDWHTTGDLTPPPAITKTLNPDASRLLELQQENSSLVAENDELKRQLRVRNAVQRIRGHSYIDGDDDEICPRCAEVDFQVVHLLDLNLDRQGMRATCPQCKTAFGNKPPIPRRNLQIKT